MVIGGPQVGRPIPQLVYPKALTYPPPCVQQTPPTAVAVAAAADAAGAEALDEDKQL